MAFKCKELGIRKFLVPSENASEAAVVDGLDTIPVETLTETVGILTGSIPAVPYKIKLSEVFKESSGYDADFADVKGQEHVKRALTVAVAGNHNVIMVVAARRWQDDACTTYPDHYAFAYFRGSLRNDQNLQYNGTLGPKQSLVSTRPFRTPHHTISTCRVNWWWFISEPGEISLSHNGVLFLDELPEFDRSDLGSTSATPGSRQCNNFAGAKFSYVSCKLYAGMCHEPLSVRVLY